MISRPSEGSVRALVRLGKDVIAASVITRSSINNGAVAMTSRDPRMTQMPCARPGIMGRLQKADFR
jgi:hypothetical protein